MSPAKHKGFTVPDITQLSSHTDDYLHLLFDHFADQVDTDIQTDLVAELMARYASVSSLLEDTNRELKASDDTRMEAQRIALLGNWRYTSATGKLQWSETMYSILEIDPVTTPNHDLFHLRVHPEDEALVKDITARLHAGNPPSEASYRLMMEDGRTKWVMVRHIADSDSKGKTIAVHGTMQDITTGKLAEQTLKRYNEHLQDIVQEKVKEITDTQLSTIYALVKLAESRDDDTGEHIERTSDYCRLLATRLGENSAYADQITEDFITNIAMASPLHDIGKVGIPDHILLKPGKLTPDEFEIMKTHVTIGYDTLASVEKRFPANNFLRMGMDIARCHHEKWDGTGYQNGLQGTDIPLSARIMTICDVYDALRSRRVYKEPFSHELSVKLVMEGRGGNFDPVIVDTFWACQEDFRRIFDNSKKAKP